MKTVFTFALALLAAASAWAYDFKAGDLYYNITDEAAKTVEVTYEEYSSLNNYSSLPGAIAIPETVSYNDTEYSVTSIGDWTFGYCSTLTQIVISERVVNIGNFAFSDCVALKQVAIPNKMTNIGTGAFFYCFTLTDINIPNDVTNIGESAFNGCIALTQINVGNENPVYCSEDGVLFNKEKNTLIQYPAGKKESAYTIPYYVTSIGNNAFAWCFTIKQITIPNSVTSIGEGAFWGSSSLTQINVENENPVYCSEDGVLFNKEKNTLIQYPAGKEESTYTIPYYVTSIGNDAFAYCSAIKQVTIHNSVTNIGDFAFRDCSALTEITIPNSVTSIRYQAFARCSSLMKVTIPNSVTSIEDYAFYDCSALTEITVLATVPPTVGVDAFYNVSRSIPVYVPADALEDYQAAETWKEFNYLQAMPTTVLQTPSMPESISIYGGLLYNPQQLPVSIYDMQGRMVYSGTAATVSQPAGVYVLRCTGASSKVLF